MTDYTIKRYNTYSDDELLSALKEYANENNLILVGSTRFCQWFGVSPRTIAYHFGKWSDFCKQAGLSARYIRTPDAGELFENLNHVWEELGRQPRATEMKQPLSPISRTAYQKVFRKTWYEVCLEFLSWKSGAAVEEIASETRPKPSRQHHKTKRCISLSLRYDILKRDRFRCVVCGRSPATDVGIKLHIDHVVPWSKGGETEIKNLRSLCSECNLGKSDK